MTSVEIRKKFLACRQYKLRGVDQVDQVIIIIIIIINAIAFIHYCFDFVTKSVTNDNGPTTDNKHCIRRWIDNINIDNIVIIVFFIIFNQIKYVIVILLLFLGGFYP